MNVAKQTVESIVEHLNNAKGEVTQTIDIPNSVFDGCASEKIFKPRIIGQYKIEMKGDFIGVDGMVIVVTLTNINTKKQSKFPVVNRSASSAWVREFHGGQTEIVQDAIRYVI
jgi:hypothetical protein